MSGRYPVNHRLFQYLFPCFAIVFELWQVRNLTVFWLDDIIDMCQIPCSNPPCRIIHTDTLAIAIKNLWESQRWDDVSDIRTGIFLIRPIIIMCPGQHRRGQLRLCHRMTSLIFGVLVRQRRCSFNILIRDNYVIVEMSLWTVPPLTPLAVLSDIGAQLNRYVCIDAEASRRTMNFDVLAP